jgi:hypothetical protein
MTALHAFAERFLNETRRLVLPPVTASGGGRTRTTRGAKEFVFDSAKLETMDGETIPDVILIKGEHRVHVEIFVTHRCGPEKRAKIAAANISAMEIDLSGLPRDATPERYHEEIQKTAPREWIYNRKAEELRKTLVAEANADAERAKRRRQKEITEIKAAYAASQKRALASGCEDHDDVQKVVEAGDADLLDGPAGGAGYFLVHPKAWKAATLNLLHTPFGFNSASAIGEFARRGWLTKSFRAVERNDPSLLVEAELPAGGTEQVVLSFLRQLAKQGIAADQGWKWTYTQRHLDELGRRKQEKQRIAYEAAERASRHKRLAGLVNDVISLAGVDEGASFDFEAWLTKQIIGLKQTPKTIADEGDAEWRKLVKELSTARTILKDESEETGAHCGLPIQQALEAATRRQVARAEQKRLEAAEAAERERQARIAEMEHAFRAALGDADPQWLDDPAAELGGLSPRAAAAQSSDARRRVEDQGTSLGIFEGAINAPDEKGRGEG